MPSITTPTSRCAGAQTRKLVASPTISAPIGLRRVLDVFVKTKKDGCKCRACGPRVALFEAEDLCTTTTAAGAKKLDRPTARRDRRATPSTTPRAAAFITATTRNVRAD